MQTIYLITTGGTIEKEYSEQLGMVLNQESKIGQYLKCLRLPDAEVRIIPLMNKDSLEMTPEDRVTLATKVEQLVQLGFPIVITHGTDTMVESGIAIERQLPDIAVPVILTGAMKPLGFDRSDGLQNITESLITVRLLGPGVYIVFHGQVLPATRAHKDRERGTFVRTDSDAEFAEAQEPV